MWPCLSDQPFQHRTVSSLLFASPQCRTQASAARTDPSTAEVFSLCLSPSPILSGNQVHEPVFIIVGIILNVDNNNLQNYKAILKL